MALRLRSDNEQQEAERGLIQEEMEIETNNQASHTVPAWLRNRF
jgi:hypothetical protein